MTSYFVYYKVAAGDPLRVRAMLADLARETGVAGRLLRRADDPATWMEVYEAVADNPAFERALEAAVARHGILDTLQHGTARYVERFVAL